MTTDTSERGLERLICTALAGHPCEPPASGTVAEPVAGYGGRGLERRQPTRLRPRVLRRRRATRRLPACHAARSRGGPSGWHSPM